jgi:hypothetical protein
MVWNIADLQKRFNQKQRLIESDLEGMRHHKIPQDGRYERFYDEQLGALYVYKIIETTAALSGPMRFLKNLKDMLEEEPQDIDDGYLKDRVVRGWKKELERLIAEFETHLKGNVLKNE